MENKIEIEYRSVIDIKSFDEVLLTFRNNFQEISHTKRLSYMGFSNNENKSFDFRSRITNSESEVVVKIGDLHAHNRVEIPQKISKDQLAGFANIFSNIADESYISERETYNFNSQGDIVISLVKAATVAYIEFEILSSPSLFDENDSNLKKFIADNKFEIIDKIGFDKLNKTLSDNDDWKFEGTAADNQKLLELIERY